MGEEVRGVLNGARRAVHDMCIYTKACIFLHFASLRSARAARANLEH